MTKFTSFQRHEKPVQKSSSILIYKSYINIGEFNTSKHVGLGFKILIGFGDYHDLNGILITLILMLNNILLKLS